MKISRIKGFLVLPFALSLMGMFSCNNTGKNEQVQSATPNRIVHRSADQSQAICFDPRQGNQ